MSDADGEQDLHHSQAHDVYLGLKLLVQGVLVEEDLILIGLTTSSMMESSSLVQRRVHARLKAYHSVRGKPLPTFLDGFKRAMTKNFHKVTDVKLNYI